MGSATIRQTADPHADQGVEIRNGKLLHLLVQFLYKLCPVFQANLENFSVINLTDANQVEVAMGQIIGIGQFFD